MAEPSWSLLFVVTLPLVVLAAGAGWFFLERPVPRAVRTSGHRPRVPK